MYVFFPMYCIVLYDVFVLPVPEAGPGCNLQATMRRISETPTSLTPGARHGPGGLCSRLQFLKLLQGQTVGPAAASGWDSMSRVLIVYTTTRALGSLRIQPLERCARYVEPSDLVVVQVLV